MVSSLDRAQIHWTKVSFQSALRISLGCLTVAGFTLEYDSLLQRLIWQILRIALDHEELFASHLMPVLIEGRPGRTPQPKLPTNS